jgi:hypothetical protein
MISIQVVPSHGANAYKLLRAKVTHEATTWYWVNKAKSRLRHNQVAKGYIEVSSADGILVAQIYPKAPKDLFYLSENFTGRLRVVSRSALCDNHPVHSRGRIATGATERVVSP